VFWKHPTSPPQGRPRRDDHLLCPALRGLSEKPWPRHRRVGASGRVSTRADAPAGSRRLVWRRVGNGVMVVGLAAGVYVLLPRLGGLSRDADELRHAQDNQRRQPNIRSGRDPGH
jgi:hypothetical protein